MVTSSQTLAVKRPAPRVGVAKAERSLTDAAFHSAGDLLGPGRGRRLLVLSEVELGTGRPDVMLLACSPAVLESRMGAGLRLSTFTEARVLATLLKAPDATVSLNGSIGISNGHFRQIRSVLESKGWLSSRGRRESKKKAVANSLLIEAKVDDWRGGLLQLTRNSQSAHATALLVPAAIDPKISRPLVERYGVGIILMESDGVAFWKRKGRQRQPTPAASLWLGELALRHLEAGLSYVGFSNASNSANAAR